MFKFGFYSGAHDEEQPASHGNETVNVNLTEDDPSTRHIARRLQPEEKDGSAGVVSQAVAQQSGGVSLVRAVPGTNACPAAPEESDLVPGVYEGGLKVWEASLDLVQHLVALGIGADRRRPADDGIKQDSAQPIFLGGGGGGGQERSSGASATGHIKHVLELGCGHGFPGIMALRQGLHVCFSDFNSEVIHEVTIPNVRLNVEERHWPLAEYYSGDWSSLSPLLDERDSGGRFDLILTAETLYTTSVADKVLEMILKHLARDGLALVASKRFYFGTGGSTQHFRDRAAANGRLVCSDAAVIDTGKGNIREVLRVSWKEEVGEGACHTAAAAAAVERARDAMDMLN